MKRFFFTLIVIISAFQVYGFGLPSKYVSINDLTSADETAFVNLDLKNKILNLKHNDTTIVFHQTYKKSTGYFVPTLLINDLEQSSLALEIKQLTKVTTDSIFVNAEIISIDNKKHTRFIDKITNLGIAKDELIGVSVSQPKKQRRKQGLIIGGLGAVITTAVILLAK